MNRLQKKCLLGAAMMHGLLVLIVVLAPAFLSRPHEMENMLNVEVIPDIILDTPNSGGGNPNIKKPQAPVIDPKAQLVKPNTPPAPPVKTSTPTPPTPRPPTQAKSDPKPTVKEATPPAVTPAVSRVVPNLTPNIPNTTRNNSSTRQSPPTRNSRNSQANESSQATAAATQAQEKMNKDLQALRDGMSGATRIEVPGAGGAVFGNWSQVVKSIYDKAWNQPETLEKNEDSVEVEITIAKDGSIIRSGTHITRKSGNFTLDKTVQQALDDVKQVPEFPKGATDSQRTLNIIFKLKSNRSIR